MKSVPQSLSCYFESYKNLIKSAPKLQSIKQEKTIFSIGGRGHYENPISDVLAFYFDPSEEHGMGDLLLRSYFETIGCTPSSYKLVSPPRREESTAHNKRIDLVLEGSDWVCVIENKIFHDQVNPFEEYEDYIQNRYSSKQNFHYSILSPRGESISQKWNGVAYPHFVKNVSENLKSEPDKSKWVVFLEDFLLNLKQITEGRTMDTESLNFVENNYQQVTDVAKLRDNYITYLQDSFHKSLIDMPIFKDRKFWLSQKNWGKYGTALFFSLEKDKTETVGGEMVLLVGNDGSPDYLTVITFFYNIQSQCADLSSVFPSNEFIRTEESRGSIWKFQREQKYKNHAGALQEFTRVAPLMHKALCTLNP